MSTSGRSRDQRSRVDRAWIRLLAQLRRLGGRRLLAVVLVGMLGTLGSSALGLMRGVPLPAVHDEFSYLLGADTFAEGRLTNPTHPHWQHFETFHVIHEPSYQSKYPPGQALLLALGKWLGGHAAWGVWLGAGVLAGAMAWALLVWLPPQWGLLAGILGSMQLTWFTYWSQSYWGGAVAAVGGALSLGALRLLWDRPRVWQGTMFGLGLGIMALSRPFEGALLGAFLSAALVRRFLDGTSASRRELFLRGVLPATLMVTLGLVWQGYYNLAVTGSPATLPYQLYNRQYAAAPTFLFQEPGPPPSYRHPTMEQFWMEWGRERHERNRELGVILTTIPRKLGSLALFFLGPGVLAVAGLRRAPERRWILFVASGLGLVVGASLLTKGTYAHYVAPVAVAWYMLLGAGLGGLHRRARNPRRLNLAIAVIAAFAFTLLISIGGFLGSEERDFARERSELLAGLKELAGDHLVLVQYGSRHNYHEEWVYNRADIDGSRVVWARQMNPELDTELIRYFDDRTVWLLFVDGANVTLAPHPLGEAGSGDEDADPGVLNGGGATE